MLLQKYRLMLMMGKRHMIQLINNIQIYIIIQKLNWNKLQNLMDIKHKYY